MLVSAGCFVFLTQMVFGLPTTPRQTFDGHKVLEILHNTEDDFRKLLEMETIYELDFWKIPHHVNDTMHVHVAPQHLESFVAELETMNARVTIYIENLRQFLDEVDSSNTFHRQTKRSVARRGSGFDLARYHTYSEIQAHMNYLATTSNIPTGISIIKSTIGTTLEGRSIDLIKVSSSSGSNKKSIFIDGGIHAREWIAPASVIYLMEQLIYNSEGNQMVYTLLSHYDVYLLPVLNPDGYAYSWTNNRMWRKNRRPVSGGCYGIDLNRNFPFQWNPYNGGSTNPCSDLYSGTAAGSERETQALTNYLSYKQSTEGVSAYLTIHSYGQMWLYPWGYTSALPDDVVDLDNAAKDAVAVIKSYDHKIFAVGSSTNVLYAAAGGSDDYAKGGLGIKYSYTLELRDKGQNGFVLPESQIVDACREIYLGFLKFAETMHNTENGAGSWSTQRNGGYGNYGRFGRG